jgi:hypothetical protein
VGASSFQLVVAVCTFGCAFSVGSPFSLPSHLDCGRSVRRGVYPVFWAFLDEDIPLSHQP